MAGIKKQIKRWYSAVPNNKPMFETPAIIATGRKRDFKLSSQRNDRSFLTIGSLELGKQRRVLNNPIPLIFNTPQKPWFSRVFT